MSADELRGAARLLRDRASKATPGQWISHHHGVSAAASLLPICNVSATLGKYEPEASNRHYIATVDPRVGRAVANWLDLEAEHIASHDCEAHCEPDGCQRSHAALSVARLISGAAS